MDLCIIGPNLTRNLSPDGETFHVHSAECTDINKYIRAGHDVFIESFATQTEVVDSVYDPHDFDCESGEYSHEFKFFPCCKPLTEG